ncbi:TRAP transporter small permease subunit [Roseobacter sp. HKCCD9010]|uniref:TRAP transporter small permease n=1 Tax=unclassified Roseobacter TaxID=196798 RepID=UPI001491D2DC|nr:MULTISPECIES: TRAP transporter small permease [unclassified Roseobacter]MBF9052085.1 TRAP transporter small permease subunit [Rhodobacterales bacterium HKCCD4356]NNV14007.1 TRAP transporter small permease subunit [Roseobacter sp. HKCCD7357]NNV18248.1 TRAP transporter small permease subunit [Roseobacter sp. HKCCD8768]NNV27706.1 TRAP transporter small permease subunit [Roseobacter sp. HKCCD8192]NNV31949.1 TRAP transporter small permease subunit [Roseobacter sp. HKCCD9061]
MQALIRIYDAILNFMALIAAGMLVWLMVSIVLSVAMRNLGIQPWAWLFTSAEYGILYMTMLGAPKLVRERGHVHIELVTSALSPALRHIVSRGVAAACVLVSLILAWYGLELFVTNVERNDYDVRAYFYPRWMLTITFPIAFSFMAIEFARFVFGSEFMHSGEAGIHE